MAELTAAVDFWLSVMPKNGSIDELVQTASRAAERISPMRLHRALRAKSPLARIGIELFLMMRQRRRVLSYLSIQEGLDWENCEGRQRRTVRCLLSAMGSIGKANFISYSIRYSGRRLRLFPDPLRCLRRIYWRLHPRRRSERGWMEPWLAAWERWHYLAGCKCIAWSLASYSKKRLDSKDLDALTRSLRTPETRRIFGMFLQTMFLGKAKLNRGDIDRVWDSFLPYLTQQILQMRDVIPNESAQDNGIAKFGKIFLGVVANASVFAPSETEVTVGYLVRVLKLGVDWGMTYPLVDNVLDASTVDRSDKDELAQRLDHLFRGGATDETQPATKDLVSVAVRSVANAIANSLNPDPDSVKSALLLLLESHQIDTTGRLDSISFNSLDPTDIRALWVNSVIKAAMIRIATLLLCGVPLDLKRVEAIFQGAVVNQFGDDLWDCAADLANGRLTPFTLYAKHELGPSPFEFFQKFCAEIAQRGPRRRGAAIAVGFFETTRCFLEERSGDRQAVQGLIDHVRETLACQQSQVVTDDMRVMPQVDPDRILFNLEDAILGAGLNRNQ